MQISIEIDKEYSKIIGMVDYQIDISSATFGKFLYPYILVILISLLDYILTISGIYNSQSKVMIKTTNFLFELF